MMPRFMLGATTLPILIRARLKLWFDTLLEDNLAFVWRRGLLKSANADKITSRKNGFSSLRSTNGARMYIALRARVKATYHIRIFDRRLSSDLSFSAFAVSGFSAASSSDRCGNTQSPSVE